MVKAIRKTQEKEGYCSDNLFSLLADLMAEIEKLPNDLQVRLESVAGQLLEEAYGQARLERYVVDVSAQQ